MGVERPYFVPKNIFM